MYELKNFKNYYNDERRIEKILILIIENIILALNEDLCLINLFEYWYWWGFIKYKNGENKKNSIIILLVLL